MARRTALLTLALLALALPAVAHDEAAAPSMRPDVVRVWHEPATVVSGEPWNGYLQLTAESNVSAAYFQVCRVGQACFNPPTLATSVGNRTYRFNSTDIGGEEGVDFGAGWRVGVRWWLHESNGTSLKAVQFPLEFPCVDESSLACQESHYFAFNVAQAATHHFLPTSVAASAVVGLLAAASVVRRRHA